MRKCLVMVESNLKREKERECGLREGMRGNMREYEERRIWSRAKIRGEMRGNVRESEKINILRGDIYRERGRYRKIL